MESKDPYVSPDAGGGSGVCMLSGAASKSVRFVVNAFPKLLNCTVVEMTNNRKDP
jgi:hypothetical protein